MAFPSATNPGFLNVQAKLRTMFGVELDHESYIEISGRMSAPDKNHFTVRLLETRDASTTFWAVRLPHPLDPDDDIFVPVLRNKDSKAIFDVEPVVLLDHKVHGPKLRPFKRRALAAFAAVKPQVGESMGFTFFALGDYAQICAAVAAQDTPPLAVTPDGLERRRVDLLRKGAPKPATFEVLYNPEQQLITSIEDRVDPHLSVAEKAKRRDEAR